MKINGKIKLVLVLIMSIGLVSSIYFYTNRDKEYKEISYKLFLEHVGKGLVDEIEISDSDKLIGKLNNGTKFTTDNPRTENFKEYLLLNNVKVVEKDSDGVFNQGISFLLMMAGVGGVAFLIKNSTKQAEKEMATMSNLDTDNLPTDKVTFDDVAGNEEAKESLKELVDFIQDPEKYIRYGARLPRGIAIWTSWDGKNFISQGISR